MKTVFNMLGGPGTGKSRSSTGSFSAIKGLGVNAEYVPEYVKIAYAWQGIRPEDIDQFEIFGEQTRYEKQLFGPKGPNVIITDSPIWIQAYYASCFNDAFTGKVFEDMCKIYYGMAAAKGVQHVNVWLNRFGPYNPEGRFQTEEEAKEVDRQMFAFFNKVGVKLDYRCDANVPDVTTLIMNHLKAPLQPVYHGGCL